MALGLTQPLTEMSTRSISWGKGSRCVRLTTYHHPVLLSRNLGTLSSWNPLGLSKLVMGLLYLALPFLLVSHSFEVIRGTEENLDIFSLTDLWKLASQSLHSFDKFSFHIRC